ncbi:phosphoribosylglycinamide formyltransferase [Acinetobacter boissieri]|uniref:Phosphoribosylglycinamide formyltransferase n=1 Tax=Acinetobacter boissieri TaxID=1219383 RepID=A0A1G6GSC9_9GAMM|nr:phosphoribosylglycinamide formyltransferase [Acinetobacter boissieri]SDB84972.1 phosphoribosylglycinamide formyltransferase-1 [Acinetobacter boissieri]
MRIAVLVSGHGSNLQALLDANLSGQIVGVLSNKPTAYALQRAHAVGIATQTIEHQNYVSRDAFDQAVHAQLLAWNVDLVVLAGFMRILSPTFVEQWEGKMLNIHPSLLPKHKGMHTHVKVLESGDTQHGCTVHFVTAQLDSGQALAQGVLNVHANDTQNSLAERVHQLEHVVYPMVVEWICSQDLVYRSQGEIQLKQQQLTHPIQIHEKP